MKLSVGKEILNQVSFLGIAFAILLAQDVSAQTRCQLTVPHCPQSPTLPRTFDDNFESSAFDEPRCLKRAQDYYSWCGTTLPVTAAFFSSGGIVASSTIPQNPNPPFLNPAPAPGQFIAKMYTEALGHAPDVISWPYWLQWFQAQGCSQATLKEAGVAFFASAEYRSLAYDNYEKVPTAYRAILNREPDGPGFLGWVNFLNNGFDLVDLVRIFFDSGEFQNLVPRICSGGSYGFSGPVLTNAILPARGPGYSGNQAGLQALLNSTPPGGTVLLAQRAVILLNEKLTIPSGVTLMTEGAVGIHHYARMARLVRASPFPTYMIEMSPNPAQGGSSLTNVWVSGQGQLFPQTPDTVNGAILSKGGKGTRLQVVRNDSPYGYDQFTIWGSMETGVKCTSQITGNLFTAYTGNHTRSWQGAMQVACDNAMITYNGIVDATDGGIVVFGTGTKQKSYAANNSFIAAGLSGYTALQVEADNRAGGQMPPRNRFANITFSGNYIATAPDTHFDIALAVGSNAWGVFGGTGWPVAGTSTSATVTNNILMVRAQIGIDVNGMHGVNVSGNRMHYTPIEGGGCLHAPLLVNSPAQASGFIQQPFAVGSSTYCIAGGF